MDSSIAKLLDLFKHVARDIIIYMLPGFVLIFYFIIVDNLYLGNKLIDILNTEYSLLILFILSYIIGHIIMAFMEIITLIEFLIKKMKCKKNENENEIDFQKELEIFKRNDKVYEYFIERENLLYYFRWNLSGAFFILGFFNLFLYSEFSIGKDFFYYFISIPLIVGVFLLCLHYVTEKNYRKKVKNL